MKTIRVIPRLDIKAPNLIKGVNLEGLRVLGDPAVFAARYYAEGADELLYIDAVASLYERNHILDIVQATAEQIFIPLTVGGGIRSLTDVENTLKAGADKIAINTAAIRNPDLIDQVAKRFGSQCMVISIAAKKIREGTWEAFTDNARERTGRDVLDWVREAISRGAGEVLLTSIDQEGTTRGFDLSLVQAVTDNVSVPVIASGGAGTYQDILSVITEAHVDAVAIAHLLHYQKLSIPEIKARLVENNIGIRPHDITESICC